MGPLTKCAYQWMEAVGLGQGVVLPQSPQTGVLAAVTISPHHLRREGRAGTL